MILTIVGIVGAAIVAASFFFSNMIWLRVINTLGSIILVIYSLMIGAYPIAALNIFAIGFNIWRVIEFAKYQNIPPFGKPIKYEKQEDWKGKQ